MLGVFLSLDFVLFYVFWEVMLVPMYFLIGVWGSERRLYAAIKFFLYTLAGVGADAARDSGAFITRAERLTCARFWTLRLRADALRLQKWLFWGFFLGVRDESADVPVPHLAAGRAHRSAHGGSVILAGVLLKMGTYGFMRILAADVSRTRRITVPRHRWWCCR